MKIKDSPIIIKIANELGLKSSFDAERAIRRYCLNRVDRIISSFGKVRDLNQLLQVVSSHLRMKFEEVYDDPGLEKIVEKYLRKGELFFHNLSKELDDNTDGMLIRLNNAKPWEPLFVAVADCRGYKTRRAYFTKWHEIAHALILPPSQMYFQFRRTPVIKKSPEEQITDRVAGDLAFYNRVFLPALIEAVGESKRLDFSAVNRLRDTICTGASMEATLRGAIQQIPVPQLLVIAGLGLKKDEERIVNSQQRGLFPAQEFQIEPKLRALEVIASGKALDIDFRIHRNMQVPVESVIHETFENWPGTGEMYSAFEDLSWWKHSRGQLDEMSVWVEAKMSGDKVFALISKL